MDASLRTIVLIVSCALGAHIAVIIVRRVSRRLQRSRAGSHSKTHTLAGFITSTAVFTIYFMAAGFVLRELGVSLTAYLASASVIGLAVSFGSQGLVQDVISGLTVVFSDLLDIGDVVDIGGQTGVVANVGIRFTQLIGFTGARIFIPNRIIANVINYPEGHVLAFLDARLPDAADAALRAEEAIRRHAEAARDQFPQIILSVPVVVGRQQTAAGYAYLRIQLRIWPGQGAIAENFLKPSITQSLRELDSAYAEWMINLHYIAQPKVDESDALFPNPAALRKYLLRPRKFGRHGPG